MKPPRWLNLPGPAPLVCAFRLKFRQDRAQRRTWHVTADERYALYLDGKRIGQGPERGDATHWFFETLSVRLPAGSHTLVALVWKLGPSAPLAQISVSGGFFLRDAQEPDRFSTGCADWRAKVLPGYRFTSFGGLVPAYYAVGDDLEIDGRNFAWGFETGRGSNWRPAEPGETPGPRFALHGETTSGHHLIPGSLPPMWQAPRRVGTVRHAARKQEGVFLARDHDSRLAADAQSLADGKSPLRLPPKESFRLLLDLGDYSCAYPILAVSGGLGASLTLRWAESLYADPAFKTKGHRGEIEGKWFCGLGDRFLPDGKKHRRYETLWWRAGRYLLLEITTAAQPLVIDALSLRETRYPLEPESRFRSDEPRLERVHATGIRTLQMCAHETYMDCPYFEQLMYVGDTRLEMLTHYTLAADSRLQKKCLALFDASRDGSGLTASRYPSNLRQTIAPFSLWWIHCVHDHALWRGGNDFLAACLPGVRAVLGAFLARRNPQGLIAQLDGWNFADWVAGWTHGTPPTGPDGVSCVINWQVVLALRAASELEHWFGEPRLGRLASSLARELAARLVEVFWDEKRGLFADDSAHTSFSEHAQCLAVLGGFLPRRIRRTLADTLPRASGIARASIYFTHYLLEAFRALELETPFFDRLDFWYALDALGLKTTPESPEPPRSDCHAWGAHPVFHSYATLLGIRPASPGFRTVTIRPFPGPLKLLSGSLAHPLGRIDVAIDLRGTSARFDIALPPGVTGALHWKKQTVPLAGRGRWTLP